MPHCHQSPKRARMNAQINKTVSSRQRCEKVRPGRGSFPGPKHLCLRFLVVPCYIHSDRGSHPDHILRPGGPEHGRQ